MAFKLTKEQRADRDRFVQALREKGEALAGAVEAYNTALEELGKPVLAALEAYNEALSDARIFAEEVGQAIDDQIAEKSERWQDGEKGEKAAEWRDEWQGATLDDVELELPEPLEEPDLDAAGALEELPEEIGG